MSLYLGPEKAWPSFHPFSQIFLYFLQRMLHRSNKNLKNTEGSSVPPLTKLCLFGNNLHLTLQIFSYVISREHCGKSIIKYWENKNRSTEELERADSIEIYRLSDTSDTADATVGPTNFFGCPSFSGPTFTNVNIIQSTHNKSSFACRSHTFSHYDKRGFWVA
jgi:hypothetical protein